MRILGWRAIVVAVASISSGPDCQASSTAQAATCVVRGERVVLENVVVRPDHALVPRPKAIAFKGRRANIWYMTAHPVIVANNMVALEAGAQVVEARRRGAQVVASVVMSADDILPGEDPDPDETAGEFRIDCRALTLDRPQDQEDADSGDDLGDASDIAAQGDASGRVAVDRTWWLPQRQNTSKSSFSEGEPVVEGGEQQPRSPQ